MNTKILLNVNQRVVVRLTAHGVEVMKRFAPDVYVTTLKAEEPWAVELWCLMQIFGPSHFMGCDPVFVDNQIVIEVS